MSARRTLGTAGVILVVAAALALAYLSVRSLRHDDVGLPRPDLETLEPPLAEALREATAHVESAPDSDEAWGRLGSLLDIHDLRPEAIVCYRRAEELDPGDFRWPYFLGVCRLIGDQTGALEDFDRARRLDPEYAPLEVYRGVSLFDLERLPEAEEAFQRARELDPSLIRAHLGLAKIALARADPEEALQHLERAQALEPQAGETHWLLAEAYRRTGEAARAERHARLAEGRRNLEPIPDPLRDSLWWTEGVTVRWRQLRGDRYRREGRLDLLLAEWQEALRADPDSPEVRFELGLALAESRRYDEAIEHYRRAIALRPDYAKAHQNLGTALTAQGKVDEALDAFTRALEIDPDLHEARYNLGNLLIARAQTREGLEYLRQAVAGMPDRDEAHLNLARILTQLERPQQAVEVLDRHLRVRPQHVRAWFEYAVLLATLGRLDEAADAFQIVAAAAPEQVSAHVNLVRALQELGQYRKAVAACRTGLEHFAQEPRLRQRLAWILATCPEPQFRNGPEALVLATALCEETRYGNALFLDTLAAACAASGDFESAVRHAQAALKILETQRSEDDETPAAIRARLDLYEAGQLYVEGPIPGDS